MSRLSANEAAILDGMNPDAQKVALGSAVRNVEQYGLCILEADIDAAANATAKSVTVPFACEVVDVIVQARATSGSGTATVRVSTNAISDAIVMAVDTTIVRAGTINDAYSTLAAGDSLNVITNGANDRGLVEIVVKRLD